MSTRREFLRDCATVIAAAMAPLGTLYPASSLAMKNVLLDDLSFAMFAGQLNTTFPVGAGATGTVKMKLVGADLLAASTTSSRGAWMPQLPSYERFSLMFVGPGQEPLPQKIYTFEHSELGRFEMFIAPVTAPDAQRRHYQAVFNRPAKNGHSLA